MYSRKSNKNTVCGRFSIYEHYYGSNGHESGLPTLVVGVAVEGKAEGCGGTGKGKYFGVDIHSQIRVNIVGNMIS